MDKEIGCGRFITSPKDTQKAGLSYSKGHVLNNCTVEPSVKYKVNSFFGGKKAFYHVNKTSMSIY